LLDNPTIVQPIGKNQIDEANQQPIILEGCYKEDFRRNYQGYY